MSDSNGNEEAIPSTWEVKRDEEGHVTVTFGPSFEEFTDDIKIHLLGRALIQLGTQLLGSSIRDDEDEDDWDED